MNIGYSGFFSLGFFWDRAKKLSEFRTCFRERVFHATYLASAINAAFSFGETRSDTSSDFVLSPMVVSDAAVTSAVSAVHGWLPLRVK